MTLGQSPEYDMTKGGLLKSIKQLCKVCTRSKERNVFFGSSISKFTKQHIQPTPKSKNVFFGWIISMFIEQHVRPTTRVMKILEAHPDDDYMWKDTDPWDVSLDNTSDSEELVNSTMTTTLIGIENNSKATQDSVATAAKQRNLVQIQVPQALLLLWSKETPLLFEQCALFCWIL